MNRRGYKSPIPKSANEVVEKQSDDGTREESSYFVGRKMVGRRYWWDDGLTIDTEESYKDGKRHGLKLRFYDNGALLSVEPYRDGQVHGKARQFAPDGSVLISYTLRNGIGLDLWCYDDGQLSEELYCPADGELGLQRWWNEDNKSIYLEQTWLQDSDHRILREWNDKGKLHRGFPQFYIHGERVTKKKYVRARELDPSLPPYIFEDDLPYRQLPHEYLTQRIRQTRPS